MTIGLEGPSTVATLIDARPMTRVQFVAIALCALVVLLDGFDMQLAALVVPAVSTDWGVAPAAFGVVLAAGLIGLAAAAAFIAPLGDRIGRRPLIICGLLTVGIGTCATAFSTDLTTFILYRLATGAGLGASLPNAMALTSEFAPHRLRSRFLVAVYANMGIGSIVAGMVTPPLLDEFGWRGVFLFGGGVSLALCAILLVLLPESLDFMVRRFPNHQRLHDSAARIWPDVDACKLRQPDVQSRKVRLADVLAPKFRQATLLLWLVYFIVTFLFYLLGSWLPVWLRSVGWSNTDAVRGAVTLSIGGVVAGLIQGWYADRGYAVEALLVGLTISMMALIGFVILPMDKAVWIALIILSGAGTSGAIFAMSALSARLYPTEIRVGGIGIASAVARIGAVLAPIAGSITLNWNVPAPDVLAALSIPVLICGLIVIAFRTRFRPIE